MKANFLCKYDFEEDKIQNKREKSKHVLLCRNRIGKEEKENKKNIYIYIICQKYIVYKYYLYLYYITYSI